MHTTSILSLFFNLYRLNMRTFVFIFHFVDLILKEFVVITFFVVNDAGDQQQYLDNNTLQR